MTVIKSGLNTDSPVSMARTCRGDILITNGADRALRWDGRTLSAENAGIEAPASSLSVMATGTGSLWGDYTVYVQFVDDEGIVSNFSPSRTISISSEHPVASLSYSNIPVSSDTRVTKRRIWRNTHGQEITWYLDVEIDDNTTIIASSTKTDDQLLASTAEPFLTEDGWPNANRHTIPPSFMRVVASFQDRTWWCAPSEYRTGSVWRVGSTTVEGTDTNWTSSMVGRKLRVSGHTVGIVAEVNSPTSIELADPISTGFGGSNISYAIEPEAELRNSIIFSEATEPESCGGTTDEGDFINQIVLQDDGDAITGLMVHGSYLYVLKRSHVYHLATAGDPRREGVQAGLVAERGCINQRCWARVEGNAFLMDRAGIYAFNGSSTESVSGPIQDYFRGRIYWPREKWFHAVHLPDLEAVAWFVCLDSSQYPNKALVYFYRTGTWSIDSYPYALGASCLCPIGGEYRAIAGAENEPMLLNEGVLDGPAPFAHRRLERLADWPDGTISGTVESASLFTVTDSTASFVFSSWFDTSGIVGAPLIVTDSYGNTQTRRISSISATSHTIRVIEPFHTIPSPGDSYTIGGIPFEGKWGSFRYLDKAEDNQRAIQLDYETLSEPTTLNARIYHNHSESPDEFVVDQEDIANAIVTRVGSANAQLSLTHPYGHAHLNIPGRFESTGPANRWVEVELKGTAGRQKVKLYSMSVDGVKPQGNPLERG